MTDRGVSEVLGFVLVFSIVISTVGAVYLVGFNGLEQTRDDERINNAVRAFDVLADNVEDIHQDDAPNRATEFKLYDATLKVGDPVRQSVKITNVGSGQTYAITSYPITYVPRNSPTRIRYSNGAVFREDRNGAAIQNRPGFTLREDPSTGNRTAIVQFVETRASGSQAVSGRTTVLVRTELARSEVMTYRSTPGNATDVDGDGDSEYNVTYWTNTTETRAPLWESYYEDRLEDEFGVSDPCTLHSSTEVKCVFQVERIAVSASRIDVSIDA
jgi:hypothetical protein